MLLKLIMSIYYSTSLQKNWNEMNVFVAISLRNEVPSDLKL